MKKNRRKKLKKSNHQKIKDIIKLRTQLYQYVYEKHVFNVLTKPLLNKQETIVAGMLEFFDHREYLQEYLENTTLTKEEEEIFLSMKNDIFGTFHLISIYHRNALLYCPDTNQIYEVIVPLNKTRAAISCNKLSGKIDCVIMEIDGKQYLDDTGRIIADVLTEFDELEKLYEHCYQLVLEKPNLLDRCNAFSSRKLDINDPKRLLLDFMGPLSPYYSQEELNFDYLLTHAMIVWNEKGYDESIEPFLNEATIKFYRHRKDKYFSQFKNTNFVYKYKGKDELEIKLVHQSNHG